MSFQFNGISSEVTISGGIKSEGTGTYELSNDVLRTYYTTINDIRTGPAEALKKAELKISTFNPAGTNFIRISFSLKQNTTSSSYPVTAQIYVNGLAVGTLREKANATATTYIEDIEIQKNDLVQIYMSKTGSSSSTAVYGVLENVQLLGIFAEVINGVIAEVQDV